MTITMMLINENVQKYFVSRGAATPKYVAKTTFVCITIYDFF